MSEPKVIGALRRGSRDIQHLAADLWDGAESDARYADAKLLDSLAEALAAHARFVVCEACEGRGGSGPIGCQYCETTGRVIVLPASLLTTEESADA